MKLFFICLIGFVSFSACQENPPPLLPVLSPPLALTIEVVGIKWVHLNNPTLSETEKLEKEKKYINPHMAVCVDCATHRGMYFTLILKNHSNKSLRINPQDFSMLYDSLGTKPRYGLSQKGLYINSHHDFTIPAKKSVQVDYLYHPVFNSFVGAEVDSAEFAFLDNHLGIKARRDHFKILYEYNIEDTKYQITTFVPDKLQVELWYCRDFRTYEEARAYGQPFLAEDGDTTRNTAYFKY